MQFTPPPFPKYGQTCRNSWRFPPSTVSKCCLLELTPKAKLRINNGTLRNLWSLFTIQWGGGGGSYVKGGVFHWYQTSAPSPESSCGHGDLRSHPAELQRQMLPGPLSVLTHTQRPETPRRGEPVPPASRCLSVNVGAINQSVSRFQCPALKKGATAGLSWQTGSVKIGPPEGLSFWNLL